VTKWRSFEIINYMLRPNKNVERKLIARTLHELGKRFPVADYRYVGFGSLWFTDFIVMHRQIGITDMVTIEKETSRSKRIEFNRPLACIDVRMKEAAKALPEVLGSKKAIVWLDYDGYLEKALEGDPETAIAKLPSGSVLLVTVNAELGQLQGRRKDGAEISPLDFLIHVTGDPALGESEASLTARDFPHLAAKILLENLVDATLKKRPGHEFIPIWNFRYEDGAVMVTVGGILANATDKAALNEIDLHGRLPFVTAPDQFEISLPILTEGEKREFDKLLPGSPVTAAHLPFELKESEVEAYIMFYLDYPQFNEIIR